VQARLPLTLLNHARRNYLEIPGIDVVRWATVAALCALHSRLGTKRRLPDVALRNASLNVSVDKLLGRHISGTTHECADAPVAKTRCRRAEGVVDESITGIPSAPAFKIAIVKSDQPEDSAFL
jgi:hypothetical protein